MPFVFIPYQIMEIGKTQNLLNDRINNPDILNEYDDETIKEQISKYSVYYKVKFIKYPKIGIDIDKLCQWGIDNNFISLATKKEKATIKWDGTKDYLIIKGAIKGSIMLRKRLTKWAESKQVIDSKTGLLTNDSPRKPNINIFCKIIDYGEDRYEWIFPDELINTNIYNYQRQWLIDPITYRRIEPKKINSGHI